MNDENTSDDPEEDDDDPFVEDPRITELVREAPTLTEVVLNAEFLLDEYVTEFLKTGYPGTYRMVRTLHMTPEQKFLLAVGAMGQLEHSSCMGPGIFGFLFELYRIRAMAGNRAETELLAALISADTSTGGEDAGAPHLDMSTSGPCWGSTLPLPSSAWKMRRWSRMRMTAKRVGDPHSLLLPEGAGG